MPLSPETEVMMRDIIKTIADDEPIYHDAEEGTFCVYCWSHDGRDSQFGRNIIHRDNRNWLRSCAIMREGV